MYWRAPDPAELAALGLLPSDYPAPEAALWPDIEPAFAVFVAMGTQWRMGMGGPVGLDYSVLEFVMRQRRVPRRQWSQVFDDVREMEYAALAVMGEG